MNVLQLAKYYPPIYGGIELVEKMITKSYSENGDQVIIHAFDKKNKIEFGEFGEKVYRLNENLNLVGAPISFAYIFNFKKLILKENIQYIYVHLPNPFMHELIRFYQKILKKQKIKIIGVYHSDIINKGFLGKLYNTYFKKTVAVYDKIIVSSEKLWNSSKILSDIDISTRVVVPFCIEEFTRKIIPANETRKKLISIGRLVPYKGFEFLINTFNDTEFELHIVGNGPLLDSLKKQCSNNVHIHHNLNHELKNQMLSSADLLVVGSINRAEAYGMTIVEAFYCGIPVIAPNIDSGVTYLVQEGVTGFIYQVLNKEMLLEKTRLAISDQNQLDQIKKNINKFYIENLSYDCFRKGILKI